jgi:hypothetical protein
MKQAQNPFWFHPEPFFSKSVYTIRMIAYLHEALQRHSLLIDCKDPLSVMFLGEAGINSQ